MGIYIKGMEMPKSCSDCPLCYSMMECSVSDIRFFKVKEQVFDFRTSCTERHQNCPLVLVPEHGDLIDRDALPTNRVEWEDIVNAPTIIEADESDMDSFIRILKD